jgi:transcriptional regulator with XRE-family HTH domain
MDDWDRLEARLLSDSATREAYEKRRPAFELASKLIELRNSLGLTQRQIAARAKMTQPEIARLESGGVEPNWETLRRVLGALGASIEIKARDPEGKLVNVTLSPGPEATKERQPKPKAVPRAS